jgi:hypothetical protein
MKNRRWESLAPLTGAVAIAVIVIAIVVVGGSTPDVKDSGSKVLAFYSKHRSDQENASFLTAIGAALLLLFAVSLWHRLRCASASGRLAMASLGGGIVAVGGLLFVAAMHLALAESGKYGDATIAHALNIVDANTFLPLSSGTGVMVFAAGASAWRTGAFPKWLGVVGVVIGIASFTPVGFPAFLACLLWVVVTSIMLTLRQSDAADKAAVDGADRLASLMASHT